MKFSAIFVVASLVLVTFGSTQAFAANRCEQAARLSAKSCDGLTVQGRSSAVPNKKLSKKLLKQLKNQVKSCNKAIAKRERACDDDSLTNPNDGPFACMAVYQPVCGEVDGELFSYPNRCSLDSNGASFVSDGECDDKFASYVQ